jgi:lipopolysaccharide heptosyltransferase II
VKKFLIINPFGIGDVLFTTPVIKAIKEADSQNSVSFWCNERVREILANNPNIDKILALSRGDLKKIYQESTFEGTGRFFSLLQQIKKERFDAALDYSLDHRYSLISKILGIRKRIGYNYKKRGRFLTDKIDLDSYSKKHIIEYYLGLLKFVNIQAKNKNLELFVSEHPLARIKNILHYEGIKENDLIIGIAPGAGGSWGEDAKLKHWQPLKFAELADNLIEKNGAKILLLGDPSEKEISDIITAAMKHKPIDLIGKTSLSELSAAIKSLKLLITNDGGPLHMAVALGTKTVSIFGPVDDKVYGPYPPSDSHIVIKKDLPCRPCYKNFRMPYCERDRECIKSISVEEVYQAARRLL